MKYTPGPWHVVPAANPIEKTIMFTFGGFADNCDNAPIATTCTASYPDEMRAEQAIANAKLIAAAPELLEACKALVVSIEFRIDDPRAKLRDAALAAIAKATK